MKYIAYGKKKQILLHGSNLLSQRRITRLHNIWNKMYYKIIVTVLITANVQYFLC